MSTSKILSINVVIHYCTTLLSILLLLIATSNAESCDTDPNLTIIVWGFCNTQKLDPNDPYLRAANEMLHYSMPYVTPYEPDYEYSTVSRYQGGTVYGLSDCDPSKTQAECSECLRACADELFNYCGPTIGATMQMLACYMRYESYEFA